MASVEKVLEYGNQLVLIYNDGTRHIALPTNGGMWVVAGDSIIPGPDPDPVSDFVWPFNPTDVPARSKWMTPERPSHKGWDWPLAEYTPVPVIADGIVSKSNQTSEYGEGWGYHIRVNHGTVGGFNIVSAYNHFVVPPTLNVGDTVSQKDIVGLVGTTGESTGNHLHFEIWRNGVRIDPGAWMTANGAIWPW